MKKKVSTCYWREDEDEMWIADCDASMRPFFFDEGTPVDNGFKFCPRCGAHLRYRSYDLRSKEGR